MHHLSLPVDEATIRSLCVGDELLLRGTIVTARDMAHKYLVEEMPPADLRERLRGGILYHCGPIIRRHDQGFHCVAAGPTTSMREEPYEAEVLRRYGVRGVIGKGGMGEGTLQACREHGAVYLHAVGGLGCRLAGAVQRILGVYRLEEFGTPEAMWVMQVEDFPVLVTMDAQGNSLHREVAACSAERLRHLLDTTAA